MVRKCLQRPETIIKIGYAALIPALLSNYFLRLGPRLGEGLVDGARGFLFGIAIGALLLGVWMRGRQRTPGSGCRS